MRFVPRLAAFCAASSRHRAHRCPMTFSHDGADGLVGCVKRTTSQGRSRARGYGAFRAPTLVAGRRSTRLVVLEPFGGGGSTWGLLAAGDVPYRNARPWAICWTGSLGAAGTVAPPDGGWSVPEVPWAHLRAGPRTRALGPARRCARAHGHKRTGPTATCAHGTSGKFIPLEGGIEGVNRDAKEACAKSNCWVRACQKIHFARNVLWGNSLGRLIGELLDTVLGHSGRAFRGPNLFERTSFTACRKAFCGPPGVVQQFRGFGGLGRWGQGDSPAACTLRLGRGGSKNGVGSHLAPEA